MIIFGATEAPVAEAATEAVVTPEVVPAAEAVVEPVVEAVPAAAEVVAEPVAEVVEGNTAEPVVEAAENTPPEYVEVTALIMADDLLAELTTIRNVVEEIQNSTIVGKANFRKAVVQTRKDVLAVIPKVKQLWKELYALKLENISEVKAVRAPKTPEQIQADIVALQAKLAAMTTPAAE